MEHRRDEAETLALQALAWLTADEALLAGFLAASGLAPADLAARAGEPDVLAAVLDFVLAEDARVIAFAAGQSVAPERLAQLRAALPGGDLPHWT